MPALVDPPSIDDDLSRREFVGIMIAAGLLGACGDADGPPGAAPSTTAGPSTRTVGTAFGPVEVPATPMRVAVLNVIALDAAITVGLSPVAVIGRLSPLQGDRTASVPLRATSLNVEALVQQRPDLILHGAFGGKLFAGEYDTLSRIAPVVAYDFENDLRWKDYFSYFADAVGRRERGEEALVRYQARAEELGRKVGSSRANLTVSVVRARPDAVQNYSTTGFAAAILGDAGISTPQAEGRLSLERVNEVDADHLYVFASEDDPAKAASAVEALRAQPVWGTLRAVQAGNVHEVPTYWFGFGVTEAMAVLDDLFDTLAGGRSR
ncbi:MAG: ABC transporter substrate-binding protein [Actinomycetota bacterium]